MNRRTFLFYGVSVVIAGSIRLPHAQASGTLGSAMTEDEIQKLLWIHNQARAEVGVQPLTWSQQLATYSQKWADHLARSGEFEHSTSAYGENLAGANDVEEAVNNWLSEKSVYTGRPVGSDGGRSGHYTQMVWRKTKRVGCGKSITPDYAIWVCSYDPPGNRIGQTPY